MQEGETPSFTFFYGSKLASPVELDNACLAQGFQCDVTHAGITFASAKHLMLWMKARFFGDNEAADRILAEPDSQKIKAIGREVKGFEQNAWDIVYRGFIAHANLQKFTQHPLLQSYLLDTGDSIIVEAHPTDTRYGTGLLADHPDARSPEKWPGENDLGFILMEVRDLIRSTLPDANSNT